MFGTNINNKGKIEKNSKVKEGECIFPFKYKYKEHNKCFPTEKGDICATTVNKNNTLQTYGYCKKSLKKSLINHKPKTRKVYRSKKRYNEEFIDLLKQLELIMKKEGDFFRSRAYTKAISTISNLNYDINSVEQLKPLPNIGETIIKKLNEYIETGKIEKIEEEKNKPEYIFNDIFGIGPKKANELVNKHNITSIEQLINNQDTVLNDVQKKVSVHSNLQLEINLFEVP